MSKVIINEANIKNNHFYLNDILTIFPKECIGGNNKYSKGVEFKISYKYGGYNKSFMTDIAGDKKILRKRAKSSGTGMLLIDLGIKVGDQLLFRKIDKYHYFVEVV